MIPVRNKCKNIASACCQTLSVQSRYAAFTLIEVLVAISLLAAAMAIAFSAYYSISRAWQRSVRLSDNLSHGNYVMEQLVAGLRCAFYPPPPSNAPPYDSDYGFWLEKDGGGISARDKISWVKSGIDLLGPENPLTQSLHRVQVTLENDTAGRPVIVSRAWRPFANPESFTPDSLDGFNVAGKVLGFSCQVATNLTEDGWEWEDDWSDDATNHLPLAVKLALYVEPDESNQPPFEIIRLVEIPLGVLSWRKTFLRQQGWLEERHRAHE